MACYNENKEEEEEKWKSICLKRSTPCVLWKWVKKMIIFSIFKFVFTFPNISYNFLIFFPIEWIFPSDFFHSFYFRVQMEINCIPSHHYSRAGSIYKWKLTGLEKTHRMNMHTHTHIHYWKSFSYTHKLPMLVMELNIQRNSMILWMCQESFFFCHQRNILREDC